MIRTLDDPDCSAALRIMSLVALSACRIATGDPDTALRYAHAATDAATGAGPAFLGDALMALARAQHSTGDLVAAATTATQGLILLHRITPDRYLYEALTTAVRIAVDRDDGATAAEHAPELHRLAHALDLKDETTHHTIETTALIAPPPGESAIR